MGLDHTDIEEGVPPYQHVDKKRYFNMSKDWKKTYFSQVKRPSGFQPIDLPGKAIGLYPCCVLYRKTFFFVCIKNTQAK